MIPGGLILGGLEVALYSRLGYLNSRHLDINEETKNKIMQEGLYHFTSKENAEKIMKSGYIIPTQGILSNHLSKSRYGDNFANFVYMFAGKPSLSHFDGVVGYNGSKDGTYYAIKHIPDKFEINNYTQRLFDGAITYEGRLDLEKDKTEIVRIKIEKGKMIEIPLDEEVKVSPLQRMAKNKIFSMIKSGLLGPARQFRGVLRFKEPHNKLKAFRERRKIENKYIAQYNEESQRTVLNVSKGDKNYIFETMGTKKHDGKVLTGFRMIDNETKMEKNIFTDAIDINSISRKYLIQFLSENMNEMSERSEYIGKPVIKDGKVVQEIDDEFKHHFYKKQLLEMQSEPGYQEYLSNLKVSSSDKLIIMADNYLKSTEASRRKAVEIIKQAVSKGKENAQSILKSENYKSNLEEGYAR